MEKLKIGILGCGKMGNVYSEWFSKNPACEVVAFYNRTYSRAEELAQNYPGSKAKKTWQKITEDEAVDIVGICTPSHEHLEQLESAVNAGKHILCEKPMARNVEESQKMHEISESSSVKVAIGFQMRFHPVVEKIDELLPKIGDIFHIDFVFGMYRPEVTWRHQGIQEGGVLKELGSHLIDLTSHWTGDITAVTARNRIISPPREVEDYSLNLFEISDKATAYLSCNYFDRRSRAISGNIIGSTGQINWQFSSYDPKDSRVILYTDSGTQQIAIDLDGDIDSVYPGHLDSFGKEINAFVDCIINNKKPLTGTLEGLKSMIVTDASYRSTREHKRIVIEN